MPHVNCGISCAAKSIAEYCREKPIIRSMLLNEASVHMALEDQARDNEQLKAEQERLAKEMVDKLDKDLWNDHE